ncbi:hypothetical protein HMPREF9722_02629 [Treponema denticola ATCC 33520]|jgi:hypothetical protein|nr:hypothetical protein HMPREF9722_02629 [Treponema denticola ATCC 33520]
MVVLEKAKDVVNCFEPNFCGCFISPVVSAPKKDDDK